MSIHIEVDTATISLWLGKNETNWYGPAKIRIGEAFFDQADSFPSSSRYSPSAAFYELTDKPLSDILRDERIDPYLEAYQAKFGAPSDRPDRLCVRYARGDGEALMQADVFISSPKFAAISRHLDRLQTRSADVLLSARFLGFRTNSFNEETFPSLADFQDGHPYITYEDFEFVIRPRVA